MDPKYKKRIIAIALVVVFVIILVAATSDMRVRQDFESSALAANDVIKIGLRTDIGSFGSLDEQGNIVGFNRDYVDALMASLMEGEDKLYDYVPISSQDAGAAVKYGSADICLGLLVSGAAGTTGFPMTDAYYTDRVVAVLRGDSNADSLQSIGGGRLGVLESTIPVGPVESYLERSNLDFTVLRYSDYESIMTDLQSGHASAVVMPETIAKNFQDAGYRILAQPLYETGYSMILPVGQDAAVTELNHVISLLEQNGTAQRLREKWGI